MYRPDRIGPWPLVEMTPPFKPGGALLTDKADSLANVSYVVEFAAPRTGETANTWEIDEDWTLPADEGILIGVKVISDTLYEPNGENFEQWIWTCSGSYSFSVTDVAVNVSAVFGHVATNGLDSGLLREYALLPMMQAETASGVNDTCNGSVNVQCIDGDWRPSAETAFRDGIFGFFLQNHSSSVATIGRARLTMSLSRYEHDLTPFDPNR